MKIKVYKIENPNEEQLPWYYTEDEAKADAAPGQSVVPVALTVNGYEVVARWGTYQSYERRGVFDTFGEAVDTASKWVEALRGTEEATAFKEKTALDAARWVEPVSAHWPLASYETLSMIVGIFFDDLADADATEGAKP